MNDLIGLLVQPDGKIILAYPRGGDTRLLSMIKEKSHPDATVIGMVNRSELPTRLLSNEHARWRDCWRWDGVRVIVNAPLARAQRLAEIRTERNKRLAALDPEWMRAVGQKRTAEADAIEAKRQKLRDIPQVAITTLDTLSTPVELESYQPEWPV